MTIETAQTYAAALAELHRAEDAHRLAERELATLRDGTAEHTAQEQRVTACRHAVARERAIVEQLSAVIEAEREAQRTADAREAQRVLEDAWRHSP